MFLRDVCKSWKKIMDCTNQFVSDNTMVRFQSNCQLLTTGLRNFSKNELSPIMLEANVGSFIIESSDWNLHYLQDQFLEEILMKLNAFPTPNNLNGLNYREWKGTINGIFSIKSAYESHSRDHDVKEMKIQKKIWSWNGPEVIKLFLWKCRHNGLLTNKARQKRHLGPILSQICK